MRRSKTSAGVAPSTPSHQAAGAEGIAAPAPNPVPDVGPKVPEARPDFRPAGPFRQCLKEGPSYVSDDPSRNLWEIPQKCTRPEGHRGPCGFAPFKDERRLVARWDEEAGEMRPV